VFGSLTQCRPWHSWDIYANGVRLREARGTYQHSIILTVRMNYKDVEAIFRQRISPIRWQQLLETIVLLIIMATRRSSKKLKYGEVSKSDLGNGSFFNSCVNSHCFSSVPFYVLSRKKHESVSLPCVDDTEADK
jgi:hypothetical protein